MSTSDSKKEYLKQYYKDHRAEWYVSQQCDVCGGKYNRSTRSRHIKSKKHVIADKDLQIKNLQNKIHTIEKSNG